MSAHAPILAGKRKRAVVSYKEHDNLVELESDLDEKQPAVKTSWDDDGDSDDDEDFSTHRKVCMLTQFVAPLHLIDESTEVDQKGATEEEGQSCQAASEGKELPFPGSACRTTRHDL